MRNIFFTLFFLFSIEVFSQQWLDVGGGVNGSINILKTDTITGRLYAGGSFTEAGGLPSDKIAWWDGLNWHSIGAGNIFKGNGAHIGAITIFNGDLIVGGKFDSINNTPVNNVARWDGINWHPLGSGFQNYTSIIYALEVHNGILYAGGDFTYSGNDTVRNIAKWNGSLWENVNQGLDNYVTTLIVYNGKLIIGGAFTGPAIDSIQQASPSCVGWDGNTWIDYGIQLNDVPLDFTIHHDSLITSGLSTVKYYNGTSWEAIANPTGGANPWIVGVKSYLDQLYVCGYFDNPPDIGRYNGIGYDSIGDVIGYVRDLENFNGELYAGGAFISIAGSPQNNIARFNPYNGITENATDLYFVYPNPTSDKIYVSSNSLSFLTNYSFSIVSESGTFIKNDKMSSIKNGVSVTNYSSGLYFLIITSKNENKIKYNLRFTIQ